MFPSDKILDTSLQRIAFHKYQDYSLAQMARQQIGSSYNRMANRIAILGPKDKPGKLMNDYNY